LTARTRRAFVAAFCILFLLSMPARSAEKIRTITVHAKRYAFVPAEITLSKGETVRLRLVSDDVDHGLAVKGLGIHADMLRKKTVDVMVTPEQTGDFAGTCSRFCGAGHGAMKLTVHVVEEH
jgi:cytochrome c oxidase subunit 2